MRVQVFFEMKTVSPKSEDARMRSAHAQLLEYRFFDGALHDGICVVVNHAISERRLKYFDAHGVAVVCQNADGGFVPVGPAAERLFP